MRLNPVFTPSFAFDTFSDRRDDVDPVGDPEARRLGEELVPEAIRAEFETNDGDGDWLDAGWQDVALDVVGTVIVDGICKTISHPHSKGWN